MLHDGVLWRRLAHLGATRGPNFWLRYSPPAFGLAAWALLPGHRRNVERSLRNLGVRDVKRTSARVFSLYALCLAEALAQGSRNDRVADVRLEGDPHFVKLVEQGGMIFVTAHTAGWELVASRLPRPKGRAVLLVMQEERDPRAQALHDAARKGRGFEVVSASDPLAAVSLVQRLRKGDIIALQIDRPSGSGRTHAVTRGAVSQIPEGPFKLAALSGAPLVPLFSRRVAPFAYALHAYPPRFVERRASVQVQAEIAQAVCDNLTDFLMKFPEQWFPFSGTF